MSSIAEGVVASASQRDSVNIVPAMGWAVRTPECMAWARQRNPARTVSPWVRRRMSASRTSVVVAPGGS